MKYFRNMAKPNQIKRWLEHASELEQQNKTDEAITIYAKLVIANPNSNNMAIGRLRRRDDVRQRVKAIMLDIDEKRELAKPLTGDLAVSYKKRIMVQFLKLWTATDLKELPNQGVVDDIASLYDQVCEKLTTVHQTGHKLDHTSFRFSSYLDTMKTISQALIKSAHLFQPTSQKFYGLTKGSDPVNYTDGELQHIFSQFLGGIHIFFNPIAQIQLRGWTITTLAAARVLNDLYQPLLAHRQQSVTVKTGVTGINASIAAVLRQSLHPQPLRAFTLQTHDALDEQELARLNKLEHHIPPPSILDPRHQQLLAEGKFEEVVKELTSISQLQAVHKFCIARSTALFHYVVWWQSHLAEVADAAPAAAAPAAAAAICSR